MRCDSCYKRDGKLVQQFAHGPCGLNGDVPRFVFRYYMCPFCKGSHNRTNKNKVSYIKFIPDEVLLKDGEWWKSKL